MRYRVVVVAVAVVAAVAGAVALISAASSPPQCETFSDAFDATVGHEVCGPILAAYRAQRGPEGYLGLPLSGEEPVTNETYMQFGTRQVGFRRGAIYLKPATGETAVGAWYSSTS